VEGRVSGVVDIPNAAVSIYLPTEIFKRNVFPTEVPARTRSDAQTPRAPGEPDIQETHVHWGEA
jgi:hypothetical protein